MKKSSFDSFNKIFILILVLIVVGFLYKRYQTKIQKDELYDTNKTIQEFLLDEFTLGKSKKPILWIHVPYEYNSRKWLNFGSRSSFDLNQPYLYLTVRSIITHCDKSFTICIIDDDSFKRLIPGWDVNMTSISDPILTNMRELGMMKLLYRYGGMVCPISFLCMKNLIYLYNQYTSGDKMFVGEVVDRNITSTDLDFYPSLSFCGAPRGCPIVQQLCDFIQQVTLNDHTADTVFLGRFDRWCNMNIKRGRITLVYGKEIGTKTSGDTPIILDDLMSNHYLSLYDRTYGIVIPANELLSRTKYEWFTRMSTKQVLESDTIIGNYLLVSIAPKKEQGLLESLQPAINKSIENKFVSFWKIPSDAPYYGLKPNFLGDNINKLPYPGR